MDGLGIENYKTSSASSWPGKLLFFVVIIFLAIIGGFFLLKFNNQKLQEQVVLLKEEQKRYQELLPSEKEEEIIKLEKKIDFLNEVLDNHPYFSYVLAILEKLTHPDIYYTSLRFDKNSAFIQIEGVAKNHEVLSQAVNGFVNYPREIKAIIIKEAKTDLKNKVINFLFDIYLQPNTLKYQPNLDTTP